MEPKIVDATKIEGLHGAVNFALTMMNDQSHDSIWWDISGKFYNDALFELFEALGGYDRLKNGEDR